MLPGGLAEHAETPEGTALRETREETGMHAHRLRMVHTRNGVALYDSGPSVPRTYSARHHAFRRRASYDETTDYGFVDPRQPLLTVTSYMGRRKPAAQSFRTGTVSHLRALPL